jgi:drug/metabolite transporter (DMT)-like permease
VENSKSLVIFSLIIVQILFGINFVTSKIVVEKLDPVLWATIRFWFSTLSLFPFLYKMQPDLFKIDKDSIIKGFALALAGVTFTQFFFLSGLKLTSASNASLLSTLTPIFTVIIVILRKQDKLTTKRGIGFALSFLGVLILQAQKEIDFSSKSFVGDLLVLFAFAATAIFLSYCKEFFTKLGHAKGTFWIFVFGTMQMSIYSLFTVSNIDINPSELSTEFYMSFFFSIYGGTLATYFISNWAISKSKPDNVALFIYLQPVVATLLGVPYLNESISIKFFIVCLLIFSGFFLALKEDKRR